MERLRSEADGSLVDAAGDGFGQVQLAWFAEGQILRIGVFGEEEEVVGVCDALGFAACAPDFEREFEITNKKNASLSLLTGRRSSDASICSCRPGMCNWLISGTSWAGR